MNNLKSSSAGRKKEQFHFLYFFDRTTLRFLDTASACCRSSSPVPPDSPPSSEQCVTGSASPPPVGFPRIMAPFVVFPLQHRGQILSHPQVLSRLLSSLAAALYAAAVLVYDTRLAFLLRTMPWSLSAACCCALDLVVSLAPKSICSSRDLLTFNPPPPHTHTSADSHQPLAKEAKQTTAHQFISRQRGKLGFRF